MDDAGVQRAGAYLGDAGAVPGCQRGSVAGQRGIGRCGKTGVPKRTTGTTPGQTWRFLPVPCPHTLPGRYEPPVSHEAIMTVMVNGLTEQAVGVDWAVVPVPALPGTDADL
jgi:hypothetical protein